jgi:hypothetical protein
MVMPGSKKNPAYSIARPWPARIVRPSQITVPVVPIKVLPYSPNRLSLAILNTGAGLVVFGVNATVTIANGFPIPGGAFIGLDQYIGEVWLVAAVPTLVGILEMEL